MGTRQSSWFSGVSFGSRYSGVPIPGPRYYCDRSIFIFSVFCMFSFSDILSIFYFGALVQLLILVAVLCFPRENRRLSREPRASKQARNDETGADPAPQLLLVPHLTCYFISMSSIQLVFCPGAVPRLFWSPDFSRPASVNFPKFRRAWAHVKIQTLYICVVDIVKQNLESWTGGDIYVYVYVFVFFFSSFILPGTYISFFFQVPPANTCTRRRCTCPG